MHKIPVKFGVWIEKGFQLYKANFKTLVLACILAVVLGAVSFGILVGPMLAGMVLLILELQDPGVGKPDAGRVFRGFDYFGPSFLFTLFWGLGTFVASVVVGILPVIGQLASLFIVYAAQALLMFGLFLIVDRKMAFWPASMKSIDTVKTNFWPFFGLSVVAGVIGGLGAIAFGIGIVFTIPIQGCILAVAYRGVFG
jgi:hypothetical protein